jgi:hypothetical protein
MNVLPRRKIVLLGMMTRIPVAGNVWLVLQYLVGFQRLGYDVYYVEAHARAPGMLMESGDDGDGSAQAAAFLDAVMRRFDLGGRWAFHALHSDGRCYGMTESELKRLYASADLIINLHGATVPLPEHAATGRLVFLETDPVALEVEIHKNVATTIAFLESHVAFFTWGENYGRDDCRVPLSPRFPFRPTRAPVVPDFWVDADATGAGASGAFTTVGSWRQTARDVELDGEVYRWSKHHEFLKFIDVPQRTGRLFELALNRCGDSDRRMLEAKGWRVRDALSVSRDLDSYRAYLGASRGEFTVAKDQNIRLRSGWFSERSAQYLAAGRPVITQDTGFSNVLPTGKGLFGFSTMEDVEAAVEEVDADYERHSRAAAALGQEWFGYDAVLGQMLTQLGL